METEKRLHRCCFTGHRPEKLSLSEAEVKPLLEKAIDTAIENGFTTFITGMAPGVDIWAAEIVLKKRKHKVHKSSPQLFLYKFEAQRQVDGLHSGN